MSLVLKRSSWPCRFCGVFLRSAEEMCWHVVGKSHRTALFNLVPEYLTELGRLQCFLDTYLHGEPILGLEYVEEQQVGFAYLYTCLLCNAKEDWRGMFMHVTDAKHVERYIDKHQPLQALKPEDFPNQSAYIEALIEVTSKVHLTIGGKSIRRQKEVAGGDVKNGKAAREVLAESDESEEKNSLKRKKVDSERGAKRSRRSSEILEYLKKFINRDHFCRVCSVSCPTTVDLYEHIMGAVHEGNLACLAPEQMKKSTRLCNFLDTYMRGEPILGLGFVKEKEASNMYVYKCQLCATQENWPHIFAHLLTVDHVGRYMEKHCHLLAPNAKSFRSMETFVSAVVASAIKVYKNLGDASVPEAACEDDGEEENPLPLDSNVTQKEQPCMDERTQELEVLGVSSVQKHFCGLCRLSYPNDVELCCHLMSTRHRFLLGDASPEVLQRLSSLKYYLGTLLKNEPLVGLEYIVQKEQGTTCIYSCLLCSCNTNAIEMLIHIGGAKHILQYIAEKHSGESMFQAKSPKRIMKTYASQICKLYGRKEIQLEQNDCNSAESKVDGFPSKHDRKNDSAVPLRKVVREVILSSTENFQTLKIEVDIARESHTCNIGEPATADEDDGEEDNPSPLASNVVQKELPSSVEKISQDFPEAKSDNITQELEDLGVWNIQNHFCGLCHLSCTGDMQLCMHLLGTRHRSMLGDAPSEVLRRQSSLKFYLSTLLKNEPFVGLEYIVQKEHWTSCFYSCLLCSLNSNANQMLLHIGGAKHITQYIEEKHFGHSMFPTDVPKQTLKTYASRICKLHGRKEICVENKMCSSAEWKGDDFPSEHNSAIPLRKVVREVISGSTENSQTLKIELDVDLKSRTCDIGEPAPSDEDDQEKNDAVFVSEEAELDAIQD